MEVILETKRLILRHFRESDADDLYEYASDPRVGPAAGWPVHTKHAQTLQVIRDLLKAPFDFAFEEKATGKMIGSGGLTGRHKDWLPGTDDEIGYVLSPAYWGRGLVPEAMTEVIRFAFEEQNLDHLWCGAYEGNHNSLRVQEKLGFHPYGEPQEVEVPLLHTRRMEYFTLLTQEEWRKKWRKT